MLTNGLVSYLLAQTPITAIVGTGIQPVPAPEDLTDYPCITYQMVSYSTEYANDGPVGVSKSRVVFDCFAARYLDAQTLALTVATALSGFGIEAAISSEFGSGGFGEGGYGTIPGSNGILPDGTQVYLIEIANIVDGYVDGSRIYRTSVHALIQYAD
jgi:hypothetical protein